MCITADEITYGTNANFVYWPRFCSAFPTQHKLDAFHVVIKKSFERYDGRFFGRRLIVRNEKKENIQGIYALFRIRHSVRELWEAKLKLLVRIHSI